MKAKCQCGHIFDIESEEEGKLGKCPQCGKVVRFPAAAQEAPAPLADEELDLDKDFDFGPSREGAAAGESPGGKSEEAQEPAFDWGEEFELEGPEEPSAPAAPSAAAAPSADQPAQTEGGRDLAFDSQEFRIESVEEEEEGLVELGAGQIISAQKGAGLGPVPAAPAAPAPAPAGAPATQGMKVCPECGRVVTELVVECPDCKTPLDAGTEVGVAASMRRTRRPRGPEQPSTIFGLMAMCTKRLSVVADIGVGGISGKSMLLQITGAFLALMVLTSVAQTMQGGFGMPTFGAVGVSFLREIVSFVIVVFSFYAVASTVRKGTSFLGIMTGLMFVRVLASVMLLGFLGLTALLSLLPGGFGLAVLRNLVIIHMIFLLMLHVYFVMGVFDMGCFGAVCLAIIAGMIEWAIKLYLVLLLVALLVKFGLMGALR